MAKCLSVEQLLWTYVTIAMHKLWPSFPSCNELWKNEVFTLTPYFWSNVNSLWSDQQLSLKDKQIPSLFIRTSDLKILISPKLQTWNQLSHFQYNRHSEPWPLNPTLPWNSSSPKTIVLSSLLGLQWLGKRRLYGLLLSLGVQQKQKYRTIIVLSVW